MRRGARGRATTWTGPGSDRDLRRGGERGRNAGREVATLACEIYGGRDLGLAQPAPQPDLSTLRDQPRRVRYPCASSQKRHRASNQGSAPGGFPPRDSGMHAPQTRGRIDPPRGSRTTTCRPLREKRSELPRSMRRERWCHGESRSGAGRVGRDDDRARQRRGAIGGLNMERPGRGGGRRCIGVAADGAAVRLDD